MSTFQIEATAGENDETRIGGTGGRDLKASGATAAPNPIEVASNLAPAEVVVSSTLSADTIFADEMLIAPGNNSVAMFANPFNGYEEEMLFIGEDSRLRWARHSNAPAVAGSSAPGWELLDLDTRAQEVVVVVHPTQQVFAFVIVSELEMRILALTAPLSSAQPAQWALAAPGSMEFHGARKMALQYSATRPGDVFVTFFTPSLNGYKLWILEDEIGRGGANPEIVPFWSVRLELDFNLALGGPDDMVAVGVDGPPDGLEDVIVYFIRPDYVLERIVIPRDGEPRRDFIASGIHAMAGLYNTPRGAGCIALSRAAEGKGEIVVVSPDGQGRSVLDRTPLDTWMDDVVVWQDNDGRAHLFGRSGSSLHVVHQVGLKSDPPVHAQLPVWQSVAAGGALAAPMAVAVPLIGDVESFAVDMQPDEYPSQHVMHKSEKKAERCAIYTQDVDTTWWTREIVRLPPTSAPYDVSRYKTLVTLKNAFGSPMPHYPVTLTSDLRCDVEVLGVFYRVASDRPVQLVTDDAGSITLKVVARSLAGTNLVLTARGLNKGVTLNGAADVHDFLGGSGTLPNHPEGISPEKLRNAKTPSGEHVFPAWNSGDHGLVAVPTPEDVLDWCAKVFQAKGGGQVRLADGSGQLRPARAMTLQTWDDRRPAYQLIFDDDEYARMVELRASHPSFVGESGASDWFGDIWQAITNGLVRVAETTIDFATRTAEIVLHWVDGLTRSFSMLWENIVNAAHLIESVFNSILAAIANVIDWIKWLLDFGDVLKTKDALLDGIHKWEAYVIKSADYAFDVVAEGWFLRQEDNVRRYFKEARQYVTGFSLSGGQPLPASVPTKGANIPEVARKPQMQKNPHAGWMTDQLASPAVARTFNTVILESVPPEYLAAEAALTDLSTFFEGPGLGTELMAALEDFGKLFTNIFDAADAETFARAELVTAFDLLEDLILIVLKVCEALLGMVLTLIKAVVACIPAVLNTELDRHGLLGMLWDFVRTGHDDQPATPTVGDFFGTAMAFPLTLLSKSVMGEVPFPTGKFPDFEKPAGAAQESAPVYTWWPPGSDFKTDYGMNPVVQLMMQGLVGISTGLFSLVDVYCDAPHLPDSQSPGPSDDNVENIKIAIITVCDLLAFGLGDLPVFWGTDNVWEVSPRDGLWWGEYFSKLPIYLGDIVVAWIIPSISPGQPRSICGKLQGPWGNAFINLLGLVETGFSTALLIESNQGDMDIVWFVVQLLSLTSSNTALVRQLPGYNVPESVLPAIKMGVDVGTDVFSGAWYTIMAFLEYKTGNVAGSVFPTGKVGSVYDPGATTQLRSYVIGFPPHGWTVYKGDLPPGIGFARNPGDPVNTVRLMGTPTEVGVYTFTLLSCNSYDPNIQSLSVEFTITISA